MYLVLSAIAIRSVSNFVFASAAAAELPTKVHASVPYYNTYEGLPSYFDSHLFEWAANDTTVRADQPVIEIVTAPNNPDGTMRNKTIPGQAFLCLLFLVHDLLLETRASRAMCILCNSSIGRGRNQERLPLECVSRPMRC